MDVSFSQSPNPGISEATHTYGSVLGSAVMVTDLFLVPSLLVSSHGYHTCSFYAQGAVSEVKGDTWEVPRDRTRDV